LNELEEEGYLERKVGIGSIVVDKKEKIKEIGVVFYDFNKERERFVLDIIKGIEEKAENKNYHLHLYTTRKKSLIETKNSLYHLIDKKKIPGLIIISPLPPEDINFIKERGIHFVVCANYYKEIETSYVIYDYKGATEKVCDKLYKNGIDKIGIVISERGGEVKRSGDLILDGYEEFCKKNGLDKKVIEAGYKEIESVIKKIKEEKDIKGWIIGNIMVSKEILKRGIEGNFVLYTEVPVDYPNNVIFPFIEYGRKGFEVIERLINGESENIKIKLKPEIRSKGGDR